MIRGVSVALICLGSLGVGTSVSRAADGTNYLELDSSSYLDGSTQKNIIFYSHAFKINDRYTLTPELSNIVNLRANGVNGVSFIHNYLRFIVTDNRLAKVGGWVVDMAYRYYPPTTQTYQQQGNLGYLTFRPGIKKTFDKFTAYARYDAGVFLQRNGYALNDPSGALPPNPIYRGYLQLLPEYDFTPELALTLEADFFQQVNASIPNGRTGERFEQDTYWEMQLTYTSPKINDFMVGLFIEQYSDDVGPNNPLKLGRHGETDAGLSLARYF